MTNGLWQDFAWPLGLCGENANAFISSVGIENYSEAVPEASKLFLYAGFPEPWCTWRYTPHLTSDTHCRKKNTWKPWWRDTRYIGATGDHIILSQICPKKLRTASCSNHKSNYDNHQNCLNFDCGQPKFNLSVSPHVQNVDENRNEEKQPNLYALVARFVGILCSRPVCDVLRKQNCFTRNVNRVCKKVNPSAGKSLTN